MFKIFAYAAIVSGSLLATVAAGQARDISVWGNTFTVEEGAAAPAPVAPRFNATVDHPERYMRQHRRLDGLN